MASVVGIQWWVVGSVPTASNSLSLCLTRPRSQVPTVTRLIADSLASQCAAVKYLVTISVGSYGLDKNVKFQRKIEKKFYASDSCGAIYSCNISSTRLTVACLPSVLGFIICFEAYGRG